MSNQSVDSLSPPALSHDELSQPMQIERQLAASGLDRVDVRRYVAEGTTIRVVTAITVLVFVTLVLALFTWGISLLLSCIGLLVLWLRLNKARAAIRASSLRVGPNQFPKLHEAVVSLSSRMGLRQQPEVYVVDAAQPNAIALRLGTRVFVLMYSQVVHGAMRRNDHRVLEWILAHELAHHALGHTGRVRARLSAMMPSLSRRDEFTCDAVAHALFGDERVAREALLLLMVGPHLYDQIDHDALDRQIRETIADKHTRKAEHSFRMTHPLMLRRIARLHGKIKL
jgi:Zn-dependent protease with chaperone function